MRRNTIMTNKEIALQLNISPASLSLILNNKPGISAAKREQVLQQLTEMGYVHLIKPNNMPIANNNLCFVIYKRHGQILNHHPFFLLMMESIESQSSNYGYHLLVTTIDAENPLPPQFDRLKSMNAKGLIIFSTEMIDEDIVAFENLGLPFIAMDNDFSHLNINTVSIHNQMGTYQAIEYLYKMGHKKIGYLQSEVTINSFLERESGYQRALIEFGMQFDSNAIYKLPYTDESSYQRFKAILVDRPSLPTAFVSDDDTIASGVMSAMREHGIQIPDEVSIIGFNDRPSCEISSPRLSSISVPKQSFGTESVDSLIKLIDKNTGTRYPTRCIKLRIGTQLIQRDSVQLLG